MLSNKYTAQQFDITTNQYYLRSRYYNPIIGRFTQEDIYRGDGLNLYAYCGNNPVIYYDPSRYNDKDITLGYYEESKERYLNNLEWNADPDNFIIVEGEELKNKRNQYDEMVRKGELPAGHHIQGLAVE